MLEKDVVKQLLDFLSLRGWRTVRTQFATMPGMFATGEPGMADYACVRFMPRDSAPARCLFFWLEAKSANNKRKCFCDPLKPKKICKVCRQQNWQDRERQRGAMVIQTSSIDSFAAWYEREFGFLHRDSPVPHKPQASLFESQI